jgi:hypothetical protein
MSDSREKALLHLIRAAEELALAVAVAVQELGERTRLFATLCSALRDEERRWLARAETDRAAARVADLMGALADVFEPAPRDESESRARARRHTRTKFDPPPPRWDTRAPWRS